MIGQPQPGSNNVINGVAPRFERSGNAEIAMYRVTSCPSGENPCISVRASTPTPRLPGAAWARLRCAYGCTSRPVGISGHYYKVRERMNNSTVSTSAQHRKSTCHEIGHAIGPEHRSTDASCMKQGVSPPISQYPHNSSTAGVHDDTEALEQTYDRAG